MNKEENNPIKESTLTKILSWLKLLTGFYVFTPTFKQDIQTIMATLADLQAATAALSSKVDALTTDVNAKLSSDQAALEAASTNTVTQADVDAVNAVTAKVEALDAQVNPPAPPAQ